MKQYSSKRSVSVLAHVIRAYGVEDVVISPGSRNAPMATHFSEMGFRCYSIIDERSAGFVALGMSGSLKKPVALCCTSGSASVNYYPAVVEAFYRNVPLLLFTADRPEKYVDIFDGQTIRQKHLFQQHSYGNFQLREENENTESDEFNFLEIKKAIELCIKKQGPVHINIPLSEPLYEFLSEPPSLPTINPPANQLKTKKIPNHFVSDWNESEKILILTGTLFPRAALLPLLEQLERDHLVVVLTEANSNLYHSRFFNHIDRYVFDFDKEKYPTYAPDLLISIGQNLVSKKVKLFLREAKPPKHWHVDEFWHPDTYFSLSRKIKIQAESFFAKLLSSEIKQGSKTYHQDWNRLKIKRDEAHETYCSKLSFSDLSVLKELSESIPEPYSIHFSNSSMIRYAQLFGFSKKHQIYCNRGVSGIDGCTSTAMGFAMVDQSPVVLITGDISFFYDINGLWNKYIPSSARIILINNGEGNIFRIIPGPDQARALDDFIATKHELRAEFLAKHFGFEYLKLEKDGNLVLSLKDFFEPGEKPKILEIVTAGSENARIARDYFKFLKCY